MPVTVLTDDGRIERPELGGGDAIAPFESELTEAVRAVQSVARRRCWMPPWPATRW